VILSLAGIFISYRHAGRLPGPLERLNPAPLSKAVQAGKQFAGGHCSGTNIKKLNHLPIDAADITNVQPYGLVVGGHVMPISHGYIWPGQQNSARDTFNVYAMADSTLILLASRSVNVETGQAKRAEYQLFFSVSCTEFYYYDLVTSLTPTLERVLADHPTKQTQVKSVAGLNIPVKAGELIGRIGGQTLDYAVWDFTKTLTGYVVPAHYGGDFPRVHLVSPFDYETDDVKRTMLSRLIRSAAPVSGKVDFDLDGKLIGGWFQEGTKFYEQGPGRYWAGHLAIAPDYIDPTLTVISIGTFGDNREAQFSIRRSAPDPKTVGVSTDLVTYDLLPWDYIDAMGRPWDRFTPVPGLRAINDSYSSQGCAAFQLLETRKLKAEFLPGRPCSSVTGFSDAAKMFTR
jgi:hypothetical protein